MEEGRERGKTTFPHSKCIRIRERRRFSFDLCVSFLEVTDSLIHEADGGKLVYTCKMMSREE